MHFLIHKLSKNKKKAYDFLFYELCIVISFAIAYWVSDILMDKYPLLAKKYHLGKAKKIDNFYSYLYFSLITQTTVGYGGTLPDGGHIITTKSVPLKILMILQLFSIIGITAWTFL